MIEKLLQLAPKVYAAAALIVPIAEDVLGAGKGPEKREQAIDDILKLVDPVLPDFLNPILRAGIGLVVDKVVAYFNKSGFFPSAAAS
jgi:hypothetical protein